MIRLYINVTNKCNENCEFCCMYSSQQKNTIMRFNTYKNVIDSHSEDFELQLEGGEPLLHDDLYLFMYYALSTTRCKKIIISTNGKLIMHNLDRLIDLANYKNTKITIKPSVNYWLLNKNKRLIKEYRDIYLATEFIDNVDIIFNVRLRNNIDDWILKELLNNKLLDHCNILKLQKYGKWKDEKAYSLPVIKQNIDDWFIYASDGTKFDKDLIARSEYENTIL
jgi:organic radical activating enzyme